MQLLGPQQGAALAIDLVQALDDESTLERDGLLHQVAQGCRVLSWMSTHPTGPVDTGHATIAEDDPVERQRRRYE